MGKGGTPMKRAKKWTAQKKEEIKARKDILPKLLKVVRIPDDLTGEQVIDLLRDVIESEPRMAYYRKQLEQIGDIKRVLADKIIHAEDDRTVIDASKLLLQSINMEGKVIIEEGLKAEERLRQKAAGGINTTPLVQIILAADKVDKGYLTDHPSVVTAEPSDNSDDTDTVGEPVDGSDSNNGQAQ